MKQKKQLVLFVFLLLIAGFIWFVYFNHDKPIVTADAIPTPQNYQPIGVDNPQLHNDAVDRARKTEYKGSGRNPFSRELPPSTQRKESKKDPPVVPSVPQAPIVVTPTVSALPEKCFGYGTVPNSWSRGAFFTHRQDIYNLRAGGVLLNLLRILRVGSAE